MTIRRSARCDASDKLMSWVSVSLVCLAAAGTVLDDLGPFVLATMNDLLAEWRRESPAATTPSPAARGRGAVRSSTSAIAVQDQDSAVQGYGVGEAGVQVQDGANRGVLLA